MNSFLVVIISILVLTFDIVAMFQFAEIAVDKGYPEKRTIVMALCFFLPIAGYLYVCALPSPTKEIDVDSLMKKFAKEIDVDSLAKKFAKEIAVQTTVRNEKSENDDNYNDQLPDL